ncbi:hypothetical protein TIFTF001_031970 [Ficus carica]|uniref:Uncharacterized protein n=1 Tax=Ficus carica TaxID=3494 RepID=A0AA88DW23_FICCA|nr:hypothetical protein TIFTF001_031970 [Ficus carica]
MSQEIEVLTRTYAEDSKQLGIELESLKCSMDLKLCHLARRVDAVIKVSQGWPISDSPLKLISLKSSDHYTKGIPSTSLSKVKERLNSMAMHLCQNISGFVDAIENILVEQMQLELDSDGTQKTYQ